MATPSSPRGGSVRPQAAENSVSAGFPGDSLQQCGVCMICPWVEWEKESEWVGENETIC